MTRKEFLRALGACALMLPFHSPSSASEDENDIRGSVFKNDAPGRPWKWSLEGSHYYRSGDLVRCGICPNRCLLRPGDRSVCRSRVNVGGKLYTLAYGNACAVHVDPIEKKPLFHFLPGSSIFSIASTGCNLRCLNCQNWEISQKRPEDVDHRELFPQKAAEEAVSRAVPSMAYTYAEPVTFYEYTRDTAREARKRGLFNVLVSNGYINETPLRELCSVLDAANINLKSFSDRIYRSLNGGTLEPVLNTLRTMAAEGVWLEITTLVVPVYVDSREMIKEMCGWIVRNLGPDRPLHLLRFFPRYRLTRLPATPIETLEALRETAMSEGIHFAYIGNVAGHSAANTYCPNCKKTVVERLGYRIGEVHIREGRCEFCGNSIAGRWKI
jgi:pyruvate formate lyase activating enzyme